MLNRMIKICSVLLMLGATVGLAQQAINMVPDASFESPLPCWFAEGSPGGSMEPYFAGKEKVSDAPDGTHVLAIMGWETNGSRILSPVFNLAGDVYSGKMQVRSFGKSVKVELALFDETGAFRVASFGIILVDGKGQWRSLEGAGVKLAQQVSKGRLALVVSGPQQGARLEVDCVGLFAGSTPGAVTDNADVTWFEAEELADGNVWRVSDHIPCWYTGYPSGMKFLAGHHGIPPADNHPVRKTVTVRRAGLHRLWVRLWRYVAYSATFTVAIEQNGKEISSREICDGDTSLWPANESWCWATLDADLVPGDAQIVLSRPANETAWVTRNLDIFVLTDMLSYRPKIMDFAPRGYIRFTNRSDDLEPFCLHTNFGTLSAAGLSSDPYWFYWFPTDKTKWIVPGGSTPWANISRLLPYGADIINTYFVASHQSYAGGYVTKPWKGTLEFAAGDDHHVVRRIEVNQTGARVWVNMPFDFENKSDRILSAMDEVANVESLLDRIGEPGGKPAVHLDLNTILPYNLSYTAGPTDDSKLVEREFGILRRLGFNGTYTPVTDPKDAVSYYASHGMQQHFGMWLGVPFKNNCFYQPDVEAMRTMFKKAAETNAPILDRVERMKMWDEPGGPSYEHLTTCDFCKRKFAENLKAQGLKPSDLGVQGWDQVVPVLPKDKDRYPELFYYTGLFRLQALPYLLRSTKEEKRKFLPDNVRMYVNYSPQFSEFRSLDQRGTDVFLMQRNSALEMGWTEDWLGYGGSPQQMSTMYALLRSAGKPENQPLGGYMVGCGYSDKYGPILWRLKYYVMIAAGARHVDVYNYGGAFSTFDSWSHAYGFYPVLSKIQHELGVIDEALYQTTRHPTDVAILYNRTAGIWANPAATSEQDAYFMQWALAHAGYDADYIPEEDIEADQLSRYKVLYLNGQQVRRAAAKKIAEWVRKGGILFGTAGAGSRDEFNRPNKILSEVFGAESKDLKLENDVGRPKYEARWLPVLDELTCTAAAGMPPALTFSQVCYRETLIPSSDAIVFMKNKKGEPAGVKHYFGKGISFRVAAVPGITYYHDATTVKDYDPDSYLPKAYRPKLRDFIAWPAQLARAYKVAETTSTDIAEIVRYDGKNRAVIFVIDYNATPVPKFTFTLPQAGQFTRAYSATGKPVSLKRMKGDKLEVCLPLDTADAVVLER